MDNNHGRIIVALDVEGARQASRLLKRLCPRIRLFKIGSQLFTACGPAAVRLAHSYGAGVFLDLKFFDIPNTVALAVRRAVHLGVAMLTLHIQGGDDMLRAAALAAREESRKLKVKRPLLIGVTVLTSQEAGRQKVLRLARQGLACGLDGLVCAAREAAFLRRSIKEKFIIVTPGIRARGSTPDDQRRTATAREAFACGADFIVVGRPILKADDPLQAVKELI